MSRCGEIIVDRPRERRSKRFDIVFRCPKARDAGAGNGPSFEAGKRDPTAPARNHVSDQFLRGHRGVREAHHSDS